MVDLFHLEDGKIVLTEICYTSTTFKEVMKVFKKDRNFLKVFLALFYMTCPDRKRNPYWDLREHEKEVIIFKECEINFSIDEPVWEEALEFCKKLYTTPTQRLVLAAKKGMDKTAEYLEDTKITSGKDGSDETYFSLMGRLSKISQEFQQLQKIHEEEVQAAIRGGGELSYDENL